MSGLGFYFLFWCLCVCAHSQLWDCVHICVSTGGYMPQREYGGQGTILSASLCLLSYLKQGLKFTAASVRLGNLLDSQDASVSTSVSS